MVGASNRGRLPLALQPARIFEHCDPVALSTGRVWGDDSVSMAETCMQFVCGARPDIGMSGARRCERLGRMANRTLTVKNQSSSTRNPIDGPGSCETYLSHTMPATATVRDLRNRFPQIKKLVEQEGEVVVTEQGTPRYRLTRYSQVRREQPAPPKDYLKRLRRHQPHPSSAAAAKALHDANRGER